MAILDLPYCVLTPAVVSLTGKSWGYVSGANCLCLWDIDRQQEWR